MQLKDSSLSGKRTKGMKEAQKHIGSVIGVMGHTCLPDP